MAVIFRHLVREGSVSACWRLADVISVAKKPLSSDVGGYRTFSITPVLTKVFEKIVAGKLSNFLKCRSLLPPSQFSHRRVLEMCDDLLTLPYHVQFALDEGKEGGLDQWNFSVAYDIVCHWSVA